MNKITAALLLAALPLAACAPSNPTPPKHEKFHRAKAKVYQFSDGRVGYQNDDGIWYYLLATQMMQNNAATTAAAASRPVYVTTSSGTPLYTGGWARGAAPDQKALTEAKETEAEVIENAEGEPIDAAEAAESEVAATASNPEALPDEAQAEAEAQSEATEAGTESTDSGSTDSGSSDAGSSDAGGGGDSGGGGDAGGGGGGE